MQKLKELTDLAIELLAEGEKYLGTLTRTLEKKSRFDNDLLYSMTVMSCEKLFVALLYHYDEFAEHHMPIALYNDAARVEPELTSRRGHRPGGRHCPSLPRGAAERSG